MNKWLSRLIQGISWPLLLGTGYYLYAHNRYGQSPTSLLAKRLLRMAGFKEIQKLAVQKEEKVLELLKNRPNDFPVNPDIFAYMKSHKYYLGRMPVYVWNDQGDRKQPTILYLHGGGFIIDPTPFHFDFIHDIIRPTNARVILPAYDKTPKYSYSQVMPLIIKLYHDWLGETEADKLFVMGDSAGGGLALSLMQQVAILGLRPAQHGFLISPWLDLGLEDPAYRDYELLDPVLDREALQLMGRLWAGSQLEVKDPRISPIYGNLDALPPLYLVAGDQELLYLDSYRLSQSLKSQGQSVEFMVGKQMNHIYPILPIYEAMSVRTRICQIINQES